MNDTTAGVVPAYDISAVPAGDLDPARIGEALNNLALGSAGLGYRPPLYPPERRRPWWRRLRP